MKAGILLFVMFLVMLLPAAAYGQAAIRGKGRQVFNVEAYGARGNGKTDDCPALQAAIESPRSGKVPGTVFLPLPTVSYYCAQNLILNKPGVWLVGAGGGPRASATPIHFADGYGLIVTAQDAGIFHQCVDLA